MANTCTCPHCGGALQLTAADNGAPLLTSFGAQWQSAQQFNSVITPPWVTTSSTPQSIPFDAERRAPARPASLESDVFVPLAQSFATGAALLVPGIVVTIYARWPWWSPLAISGGGSAIAWLYLLNAHRKLLWLVETISHIDINGDRDEDKTDEPDEVVMHVRHEDSNGRAPHQQLLKLPKGVSRAMLTDFARRYRVVGVSQSAWTGTGNPFSKPQYIQFMATLREAGIAKWVDADNHSQGHLITRGGRSALEYLSKLG